MPCSSWKKLSSILRRKLNVAWPAPVESNLKDSLLISAFLRLKFCTLNTSFSTVWLVLHDGAWCLNVCSPRVLGFLCSRMSSVSSEWMKFSYLAGSAPGDPQSPSNNKTLGARLPTPCPQHSPWEPRTDSGGNAPCRFGSAVPVWVSPPTAAPRTHGLVCGINGLPSGNFPFLPRTRASAESLSHLQLFATLRTLARQAPMSIEFSRQESSSGLHFLLQGIFLTQGSNLDLLHCGWIWAHEALIISNFQST